MAEQKVSFSMNLRTLTFFFCYTFLIAIPLINLGMAGDQKSTVQLLTEENAALVQQVAMWKARALALERAGDVKLDLKPFNEYQAAVKARVDQILDKATEQFRNRPIKHSPDFTVKISEELAFDQKKEISLVRELTARLQSNFAGTSATFHHRPNLNTWASLNQNIITHITLSFE